MDYLLHIELAAENLQFYLWYRDYCNRFAEAPESERVLAPRWSATQAEVDKDVISQAKGPPKLSLHLPETLGRASMELKETDIPPAIRKATVAPPSTAGQEDGSETLIGSDQQTLTRPSHGRASSQLSSYGSKETRAFETVDLLYEPCQSLVARCIMRPKRKLPGLTLLDSHDPTISYGDWWCDCNISRGRCPTAA